MSRLYTLDIEWEALTDVNIGVIREQVDAELDTLEASIYEELVNICKLNRLVTADLLPKVDRLIDEYDRKTVSKKRARHEELTGELGLRIHDLLPVEETEWFAKTYEFGTGPMLDLHMNDSTILILKVYHWCANTTPKSTVWDEMIPLYRARKVKEFRYLSG